MKKSGIFIIGAKGVGKTKRIKEFLEDKEYLIAYLSAKEAAIMVDEQFGNEIINTAKADFYKNEANQILVQQVLFQYFESKMQPCFIYDGHIVHEDDNEYHPISIDLKNCKSINAIIMIRAESEKILENRLNDTEKQRPLRTSSQIDLIQAMNLEQGRLLASNAGLPFYTIDTDDRRSFSTIVLNHLRKDN